MIDHYKILKVSRNASLQDIKKSYKRLALKYHPDKNKDTSELFKQIVNAYAILSDSKQRSKYDLTLRTDSKRSSNTEPVNGFKKENTIVLNISLDDFIKQDTVTIDGISIRLPNYVTPYLELIDKKNNTVYTVKVNFTSNLFRANRFVFKYRVIDGMACTILEDNGAYKRCVRQNVAITPAGPVGLDASKIKEFKDHVLIPNEGLPVQDPFGRVLKSILIISKKP